jgi:hypothetical protein
MFLSQKEIIIVIIIIIVAIIIRVLVHINVIGKTGDTYAID